jgi:hypothetical protein
MNKMRERFEQTTLPFLQALYHLALRLTKNPSDSSDLVNVPVPFVATEPADESVPFAARLNMRMWFPAGKLSIVYTAPAGSANS